MANIETFFHGLMASDSVKADLRSIKFQKDGAYAEIHDGALVKLGELAPNAVYGAQNKDYNTYLATAPTADTDKVAIVDLSEVSQGTIAGNVYKIGIKQVGLKCAAGYPARVRFLKEHDMFWISGDCFTGDPVKGQYAVPTANDTHFTPAAVAAQDKLCVKIQEVKDFTVGAGVAGQGRTGKLYLCEVL